jgi:hypothetical protein
MSSIFFGSSNNSNFSTQVLWATSGTVAGVRLVKNPVQLA